jgi:predicted transcriptional regulator
MSVKNCLIRSNSVSGAGLANLIDSLKCKIRNLQRVTESLTVAAHRTAVQAKPSIKRRLDPPARTL